MGVSQFIAGLVPALVMVISLGVPVRAAFNPVLFTDSPSVETLVESVVSFDTHATATFMTFALSTVPELFVTVHVWSVG